jgi:hypothetical protein
MPRRQVLSWAGGYATDLSNEQMRRDQLKVATNLYWDGQLRKRKGVLQDHSVSDTTRGIIRLYIAGKHRRIRAVDDGTDTRFEITTTSDSTYVEIDTDVSWRTGEEVEFAVMDGKVVATNGFDRPLIIWVEDVLLRGNCESATHPLIDKDVSSATLTSATWAISTVRSYDGSSSFRMTKTAGAGTSSQVHLTSGVGKTDLHGLTDKIGTLYNVRSQVYTPSSGGPLTAETSFHLEHSTNGSTWTNTASGLATTQDAWEAIEAYDRVESTGQGIQVYFNIATAAANTEFIDVDDIHVFRIVCETLDNFNAATRGNTTWKAGQFDASGTGDTLWIDDTTDAQDTGDDNDFQLGNTTANDGHFISCDLTFTKVVYTGAQQAGGSPVVSYQYYNGTSWIDLSLITTPSFTAAAGDRTLEFDYPTDWALYDLNEDYVKGRYVIRVRFTTAASGAFSADSVTVSHTQLLTQFMGDLRPELCYVHNNRMFLAAGEFLFFSLYRQLNNWDSRNIEYFHEGGRKITGLKTLGTFLCVFAETAINGFFGDSYLNWSKKTLAQKGTKENRSIVEAKGMLYFVSDDGLYAFNGNEAVSVSNHCRTDFDAFTLTGACAVNHKNQVMISFPASSTVWRFNPESLKQVRDQEWEVALFKWDNFRVDQYTVQNGAGDDDKVIASDNGSTKQMLQVERTDQEYDLSSTAITATLETGYYIEKDVLQDKIYGAAIFKVSKNGDYAYTFGTNEGDVTVTGTMSSGSGSTPYTERFGLPYTLDGKDLNFKLVHATTAACEILALAYEYEGGAF